MIKTYKNQELRLILIIIICTIFSLIIELLFFNYPGIRTYFEKNKDVEADFLISNGGESIYEQLGNTKYMPANKTLTNGINTIHLKDLNIPISSINIYYNENDNSSTTYNLSFTAYGNEYLYYKTEPKTINSGKEAYLLFDTKSNCYNINIDICTNAVIKQIDKIVLNHPNFNFSLIRIFSTFCILLLIYFICTKKIYYLQIDKNKILKYTLIFILMIIILLIIIDFYNNMFSNELKEKIYKENYTLQPNSCNLQLKSIIENNDGNFDISKFSIYPLPPLYDVAEYKDKYYNYTNNIIIYLVLLPFYKITGMYINIYFLNLILLILSIISTTLLYIITIKTFIKKASLFNYILGYFALILGSNILFARRIFNPDIAFLTNFNLVVISLIVLFCYINASNKIVSKVLLIMLGITLGLLIYNTPLGYLYSIFYIALIAILRKDNPSKKGKLKLKQKLKFNLNISKIINYICILLPILIFIIITCNLNIRRFDLPFEYGNNYNLASLDNTRNLNCTLSYYIKGLIETIIITPNIDFFKFPFFKMDIVDNNTFANDFAYEHNVLGLISFPVIWFLIFKKFLNIDLKTSNNNDNNNNGKDNIIDDTKIILFINIMTLFSFVILIANFLYSGISEIYTLETKFLLMLSSILFILRSIENAKITNGKTTLDKVFLLFATINTVIMIPIFTSTDKLYLYMNNVDYIVKLKNYFMFWI